MKCFIVSCLLLAVCVAGVLSQARMEDLEKIGEACRKENNVGEDEFKNLKEGKLKPADVKENMKCSVRCFMTKAGFMNDAGQFNADAFKAAFSSKPEIADTVEKCKALDDPNPCEKAFKLVNCVFKPKDEM